MTGGRAVVLGETGRNFAAGMSGGIAYVYDRIGTFGDKVNQQMVSLASLDDEDAAFLEERVGAHLRETDSAVAGRLLGDWDSALSRFVKVMPDDFRRVSEAAQRAEERGESVVDAIMAASRG